ncbi:MAG TPA: methyltransferase domain-containing protein [Puia sp.]|jgi:SAM-dependent methyltransferase|nr:methyltransferase domain-containing protein [Puia sp.]
MELNAGYWNERYDNGKTGWDMQQVSPPLQAYFAQLRDKTCSILIPGCGNAYEAAWLQQQGFSSITLADISEVLTSGLRKKFGDNPNSNIRLITGDFFDLSGQYDLIVEQTFFCALDPSLRTRYVQKIDDLLNPGGKLIGLLFDRNFVGGPPFGGHKEEYRLLLEKKFKIKTLAPCYNSIPPRAGTELFFIAERP